MPTMLFDTVTLERVLRCRSKQGTLSPFPSTSAAARIRLRRTSVKTSGRFVKIQESRPAGKNTIVPGGLVRQRHPERGWAQRHHPQRRQQLYWRRSSANGPSRVSRRPAGATAPDEAVEVRAVGLGRRFSDPARGTPHDRADQSRGDAKPLSGKEKSREPRLPIAVRPGQATR